MKDDILNYAALCRSACERYNVIHQEFWGGLGGMCGMASHFLFEKLQDFCSPVFIMGGENGSGHCWVRVGRFHVDITATQFDQMTAPVYTFRGKKEDHPILNKWSHRFPKQWEFFEAKTSSEVRSLLKGWPTWAQYRGDYKKRLDVLL